MKIVIIADEYKDISKGTIANNDMEGNSQEATEAIKKCVSEIADSILYTSIDDFCLNIQNHKNDIIFPIRYGTLSKTQKGLIPAICEANKLKYIGADCYAHILCNDKALSKLYARQFGFFVPQHFIYRGEKNQQNILNHLKNLKLPLVIKPNFGGGSSGISTNNLVDRYDEAVELIIQLYKLHHLPIMAEEYIPGEEVSLLIIGNEKQINFFDTTQIEINKETLFNHWIWGFENKKIDDSEMEYRMFNGLSENEKSKGVSLFQSFEKIDYMRIDGRVMDNTFYVLELSPDCYIGPDSDFAFAFRQNNKSYKDLIELIIKNSLGLV